MTKQYKIDIFTVLEQLSLKDKGFIDRLTDEEIKSLAPLTVMRWLSGPPNSRQIHFLNELVNPFVFSLRKHPLLLLYLLSVCTSGKKSKPVWIKTSSSISSTKTSKTIKVIQQYFHYNSMHAKDVVCLFKNSEILDYAEQLGWQSEEIKVLENELKQRGEN